MPPMGFEPTISAGERPQTYALDRVATGTGDIKIYLKQIGFGDFKSVCLLLDRDQWQATLNYLWKCTFQRIGINS